MTSLKGWWGVYEQARNPRTGEITEGKLLAVLPHLGGAVHTANVLLLSHVDAPLVRSVKGSVEIVRAHIEEAALEIERLAEERADGRDD